VEKYGEKGGRAVELRKIMRELERIWLQMTNYFPYILIWYWKKWLKKTDGMIIFLRSPIHYVMFENMHAFLPEVRIVAGNKKNVGLFAIAGN
jgi:hypothetical protein